MKDKRNCNNNMNYPVYGGPMMMPPMGYPNYQAYPNYNNGLSTNTLEQQFNNLEQQLNQLDQRVTRLERQYMNNNSINIINAITTHHPKLTKLILFSFLI